MALLLRWTHPDADRAGTRAAFASRITKAWENLKTQERRDSYDASHPVAREAPPCWFDTSDRHACRSDRRCEPPHSSHAAARGPPGILRRAIGLLLGGKR